MDTRICITFIVAPFVIFGGAVFGIFMTKTQGFGKYTTSVLVLVLALFVTSLSFILGKIESQPFMDLLFAVVGYAGGLIVGKE